MLIARELRKRNIAEYILYMWQVEDSLRACSFDETIIDRHLVKRFQADESVSKEIFDWYRNLSVMMQNEHVQEEGHLQVFVNLVNDLNEFHHKLLQSQKDQEYLNLYAKVQSAIYEFAGKNDVSNEIEVCFQALYKMMILKLGKSEISGKMQELVEQMAHLVGHLSARYIQFENDDFEF
jgi:hypothetical protein